MNKFAAEAHRQPLLHASVTVRSPGDPFLHPLPLAATATLVINDYMLKAAWPGPVTGKLSDFADLFIFSIILVCLAELAKCLARKPPWAITNVGIVVACGLTAVTFTLVKTCAWASGLYADAIGSIRWAFRALACLFFGGTAGPVVPIDVVTDPTDVVAVVAVVGSGLWMLRKVQREAVATNSGARIRTGGD
jgi:hypothetical protein